MTHTYDSLRLSKHFVLLDFMYDRDTYTFNQPLPLHKVWNEEHEEMARILCEELLEPCIEYYGACSIAGGFWPHIVQSPRGHHATTPHHWDHYHGAAADVVWHDWVALNKLTIHMAFDIDEHRRAHFDRLISYGGSEFLCMATKGGTKQRAAIHENRRTGVMQNKYTSHHPSKRWQAYRNGEQIVPDHQWRRNIGEGVHSTARQVRPQHIRVGEYFTLLDLAHNTRAVEKGVPTVPSVSDAKAITASRMFAEVLDPVVREFGRVSVVRGIEPPNFASEPEYAWVSQLMQDAPMRLSFVLPEGTDDEAVMDVLEQHPDVCSIASFCHASNSSEIELTIYPFEVERHWSSCNERE